MSIATAGALDRFVRKLSMIPNNGQLTVVQIFLLVCPNIYFTICLHFSVVKFWDSRSLKSPVTQACSDTRLSNPKVSEKVTIITTLV